MELLFHVMHCPQRNTIGKRNRQSFIFTSNFYLCILHMAVKQMKYITIVSLSSLISFIGVEVYLTYHPPIFIARLNFSSV